MASCSRFSGQLLGQACSKASCRGKLALPRHPFATYATKASTSRSKVKDEASTSHASAVETVKKKKISKAKGTDSDVDSNSPIIKRYRTRKPKSTEILAEEEEQKKFRAANRKGMDTTAEYSPDPSGAFPHLPPLSDWTKALHIGQHWEIANRYFVGSKQTAEQIVKSMNLSARRKAAGRKLTILEIYPGPGTMTRQFMQDENVERVIALEDHYSFRPWLQSLTSDPTLSDVSSKLQVKNASGYQWESFSELTDEGMLDHLPNFKELRENPPSGPVQYGDDWKATSPVILFCHLINSVKGEQLLAQFCSSINMRHWQFRYSRMPMVFVCSEHVATRCIAPPGHKLRSRMSVLTQSAADAQITLDSTHFTPYEDHFWPSKASIGPRLPRASSIGSGKLSSGMTKQDMCLLAIEPKVEPLITSVEMEAYEYIIRNLFVMRASPIKTVLAHLAPGAINLLNVMKSGHPAMAKIGPVTIDPETKISDLSTEQLVGLAKLFERWPFRPASLIEEGRMNRDERLSRFG